MAPGEDQPAQQGNKEEQSKSPAGTAEEKKEGAESKPKTFEELQEERWKKREPWLSVHGQATAITEWGDNFLSPYFGPNSLLPKARATTETATLFVAARLWQGCEIVFNPEVAGGLGLSGTVGLGGINNGEATRAGTISPTPYIARLMLRHVWELDGPWEKLEDAPNQVAGHRDISRITLLAGKMSATDLADQNRYSHDPRTQFENWSLMYNTAWDYPANVRGYTYGVALDFNTIFWAARYGIFGEPNAPNGDMIDPHIDKANGQVVEFEQRWGIGDHPGAIRELFYLNHAKMGKYRLALEWNPTQPNLIPTESYRYKYGFGLNLEQELARDLGVFGRLGWNDGHSESWAFTEVDRTLALGVLLAGRAWRRPQDQVGLAGVINGLSHDHREYLAAGGLGFDLGDGALNYGLEEIVELFYCWQLVKGINATLDLQGVNHPGYNRDRGPVFVAGLRLHLEY